MGDFTVGRYLATRLEQIGLKHYFMVPGDYNLVLLDELLWNKNIEQIGCCNELNAAYAAERVVRAHLEPAPSPACPARIRDVLQRTLATPNSSSGGPAPIAS